MIAAVIKAWSLELVVLSVKFRSTVTTSPIPNRPDNETVYCAVDPSSADVDPVMDQRAGPSGAPSGPWVSSIMVVTSSAVGLMPIVTPVVAVGLVNSSVKLSEPSMNASSVMPRSITKGAIEAPSAGDV